MIFSCWIILPIQTEVLQMQVTGIKSFLLLDSLLPEFVTFIFHLEKKPQIFCLTIQKEKDFGKKVK